MKELYPWLADSWRTLSSVRDRLPHALLLKGAEGIGKLDLAVNFAQGLLCEQAGPEGQPCHACDSCHWFSQGNHPDFRLIQPESLSAEESEEKSGTKKPSSEIAVEQIRALSTFANISSHRGGYRIVLIHPAEAMNTNSANSLLKTLEEPTPGLLFILVTHKVQRLLPTILSRCMTISVPTPERQVGVAWLKRQGVKEPDRQLAENGFAPLAALEASEVDELESERALLLPAVSAPGRMDALALAETLQRKAMIKVVHFMQQWCYDIASVSLAGQARYFPDQASVLLQLAGQIPAMRLLGYQKELQKARRDAFHPLNPRLNLENLFLSYRQLFAAAKK